MAGLLVSWPVYGPPPGRRITLACYVLRWVRCVATVTPHLMVGVGVGLQSKHRRHERWRPGAT